MTSIAKPITRTISSHGWLPLLYTDKQLSSSKANNVTNTIAGIKSAVGANQMINTGITPPTKQLNAIDIAPAITTAIPNSILPLGAVTAITSSRLEVEVMPSFAPNTAQRFVHFL